MPCPLSRYHQVPPWPRFYRSRIATRFVSKTSTILKLLAISSQSARMKKRFVFGSIYADRMQLNVLGEIVKDCLVEIPRHFANVEIPVHSIMPNHLHSILVLRERAQRAVPLLTRDEHTEGFGEPVAGSVPTIVRSFKSAVTRRARIALKNHSLEVWQPNYFERVIRSTDEFRKTWQYFCENPAKWDFDPENPQKRQ